MGDIHSWFGHKDGQDWLYRAYLDEHPGLAPYVDRMAAMNDRADVHIQAKAVCCRGPAAITVELIVRQLRELRSAVRDRLGVAPDMPLVLTSTGGALPLSGAAA